MGKLKDQAIRLSELGIEVFNHYGYRDGFNHQPQLPPTKPDCRECESAYHEGYATGMADRQRIDEWQKAIKGVTG